LKDIVKEAFDREIIDPSWLDYQDFEHDLALALLNPTEPWGRNRHEYALFGDTIEELSTWYCFSEKYSRSARECATRCRCRCSSERARQESFARRRPQRSMPCGSGKKYKKCCLH